MSGDRIFGKIIEFEIGFLFRGPANLFKGLTGSKSRYTKNFAVKIAFSGNKKSIKRQLFFSTSGTIYDRLVSLVALFFALRTCCASSRMVKTSCRRFANRFCSSHYCLSHCMGCRKEHLRMFSLASPSVLCVCCEGAPVSFFLSLFSRFFVSFLFLSLSSVC